MVLRRLPSVRLVLVLAALVTGGCPRNEPPPEPPVEQPASDGLELRYTAAPLTQTLELELTDTRVGQYIEAKLTLAAALETVAEGDGLRTRWSLDQIDGLELTGTVQPDEIERTRTLLLYHGRGVTVSDAHGVPDLAATDADPSNAERDATLGDEVPPAGVLLMTVLAEQLRLPRLTAQGLRLGEPMEHAEESETAIAGTDLVLPTTTVHRVTVRNIDESGASRVAEVALELASVAEPEEGAELEARLETRMEGTLLFDLDHGVPLSLELSRTDSFQVGEAEGERSLTVRSSFRSR